ncbi:hypothetical protein EJ05DRAFT_537957 [Pseudovirgaria hyperparasitica]|uniref:Uncharacterized protein n=1 Tax=Pseudovirgaria hyperparasitica TaxID=470096 RepID=A0A6A6W7W1_9PEZI|nr:uncharacterized protein EJ05DRAFT_537957 [Pseudovirgaria hyperparasitica]KAF2758625.1 hypothetical protein EJ05DRAFT_537957 [Pseudovirgaria hyperparasitica]
MTDTPAAQLQGDLRASIAQSLEAQRPLLHHLNADSSWLLQIPRPKGGRKSGNFRKFYNVLIDPWLAGGQSDVASWFSQQFHATESKVGSIEEVEQLIRRVEGGGGEEEGLRVSSEPGPSQIDVVAISHEFTDHCHKETLMQVHPDVAVFANDRAVSVIQGFKHFRTIVPIPAFQPDGDTDWRITSLPPLPDWVSITRLINPADALYYHAALMITFPSSQSQKPADSPISSPVDMPAEAIIYTPHGISASAIPDLRSLSPPIHTLALLHGLHAITLTKQKLNLGAHNGLQAQRKLQSRYWIGTHDEIKRGGGIVARFLRRKVITLQEAVEQEKQGMKEEERRQWADVGFLEVENGESVLLR